MVTTAAHTGGGGTGPHGGALILLLLVCATAGAAVGGMKMDNRPVRLIGVVVALCVTEFFGHLVLVLAGGFHHPGASTLGLTPSMLGAHAAAAVVLGIAITAVENLYVVAESVLRWLRLFAAAVSPHAVERRLCRPANVPAVQSVLRCTGLGMRAPPAVLAA
jgi:hypothetical protein